MPFPFYKQPDSMDCGPTCLRMVAKHYERAISLQALREKAQIGKEGVNSIRQLMKNTLFQNPVAD